MFQKRHFSIDISRDQIIEEMKKDGFKPELVNDEPNFIYKPHKHNETKLIVCLEGSMKIVVDGKTVNFEVGDKLRIPGDTLHSAVVGNKGCVYFWSEK
jgi:quercetin dioxygenase-like cupin family protein